MKILNKKIQRIQDGEVNRKNTIKQTRNRKKKQGKQTNKNQIKDTNNSCYLDPLSWITK